MMLPAQPHPQQGLQYGLVETVEGQRWLGVLRWGEEEAFWDDLFISRKQPDLRYFSYLSGDQIRRLSPARNNSGLEWNFWSLWRPRYPDQEQLFRCRFGDLDALEVTGPDAARLSFRNGQRQLVQGGESPGKELHLFDEDNVERRFAWSRIRRITFLPTPVNARNGSVKPLYGQVFTPQGAFEGFIQWDAEERLTTDLLDGKTDLQVLSIPFGDIQEIRAQGDSSLVTTFQGKSFLMGGGDDVSFGNHDIIVKSLELGTVRIPWAQFRFARFSKEPATFSPGYEEFGEPSPLCGTATLQSGRVWAGTLAFDLDEHLDLETVEGMQDGIYYYLPFRNIVQVERRSFAVCAVTLRNGDKLFLGEEHDLSDQNWGLLLWVSDNQVEYVPWPDLVSLRLH